MQSIPFREQYSVFVKHPFDSRYVDEYLSGTEIIARFLLDKTYNSFLSDNCPLINLFPSVREELELTNSLIKEFNSPKYFQQIWKGHPHLTSLLQVKVDSNKKFVSSILERIQKDKKLLAKEFEIDNFSITNLEISKGDVHQEGKTTAIVTFAKDVKIVYKPRTAGLDIAFGEMIKSFNEFDQTLHLKSIKLIDLGEYSWCEYVENSPCNSESDLEDYYQKAGVLLAFMFFLKGVDIHFENIIANGSNPVIIDLECLFNNTGVECFNVLNTGMFPVLSLNGFENQAVDLSGMGAFGDIKMDRKEWEWVNVETDALNLEQVQGYIRPRGNMPIYNNEIITPKNYLKQILTGFDKATAWVKTIQDQIQGNEPHPFEVFQNKQFRIIPRMTLDYTDILNNSYTPNSIISASSRKESISSNLSKFKLNLPFLSAEDKRRIIEAEQTALERLDIPYFTGETSTLDVKESGRIVLKEYFERSPYDGIIEHILRFDATEAALQKNLIRSSFASCYNIDTSKLSNERGVKESSLIDDPNEQIEYIAENILSSSVIQDNELTWNSFIEENGTLVFNPLDHTLYSGKIGIAIFFSNLAKHVGTSKYDTAITLILNDVIDFYKTVGTEINISFASGVSGLIHALLEVDPIRYKEVMLELSELITIKDILKDEVLDIIGGAAGCLSVLCSLYSETKSKKALSLCLELGNHLMSKRVLDPVSQRKCWVSSNMGIPLTGYSHGASGIGLALLKLYEISKKEEFKEAFYEALRFENHYYVDAKNNWKDLRSNQKDFQISWCHGAPGIGLARVEAYRILKEDFLLEDIQRAIDGVIDKELSSVDHYCCGNTGRLHFLIEASTVIENKELEEVVDQKVKELLIKRNRKGYFQTQSNPNVSIENPSLFRGTSGIGQILLRFCQIKKNNY